MTIDCILLICTKNDHRFEIGSEHRLVDNVDAQILITLLKCKEELEKLLTENTILEDIFL